MVHRPAHFDLVCEPRPGGSLSPAAGEALEAVLYPARVSSLSDALVAEERHARKPSLIDRFDRARLD
jgi:hypothetical protein